MLPDSSLQENRFGLSDSHNVPEKRAPMRFGKRAPMRFGKRGLDDDLDEFKILRFLF